VPFTGNDDLDNIDEDIEVDESVVAMDKTGGNRKGKKRKNEDQLLLAKKKRITSETDSSDDDECSLSSSKDKEEPGTVSTELTGSIGTFAIAGTARGRGRGRRRGGRSGPDDIDSEYTYTHLFL
jgi:hypothetical protein